MSEFSPIIDERDRKIHKDAYKDIAKEKKSVQEEERQRIEAESKRYTELLRKPLTLESAFKARDLSLTDAEREHFEQHLRESSAKDYWERTKLKIATIAEAKPQDHTPRIQYFPLTYGIVDQVVREPQLLTEETFHLPEGKSTQLPVNQELLSLYNQYFEDHWQDKDRKNPNDVDTSQSEQRDTFTDTYDGATRVVVRHQIWPDAARTGNPTYTEFTESYITSEGPARTASRIITFAQQPDSSITLQQRYAQPV